MALLSPVCPGNDNREDEVRRNEADDDGQARYQRERGVVDKKSSIHRNGNCMMVRKLK